MHSPAAGISVLGVALRFHARNQRAGALLTPASGAVLLVDPAGLIADAGGSPPSWPGRSLDRLEGCSLLSMIVDRDQLGVAAALTLAMGGSESEVHCLGHHHDGTVRSLTLAMTPVCDPHSDHAIGATVRIHEGPAPITRFSANSPS